MKAFPASLCIFLGLILSAFAQDPHTPEDFLAAFRTALAERSPAKLDALTYSVGMTEADKALAVRMQQYMFTDKEIESLSLQPLPEDFQTFFISRGKKIEPTNPPVGLVDLKYKPSGNGTSGSSLPYTIVDGRYFLVGTKSTLLDWKGPADKNIGYMVMGAGQDGIRAKVKWNASGVDMEHTFKAPSLSFQGQFIKEVMVTSETEDTNVTLTIVEDGKPISVSEPLKGKGKLEYKRP